MTFKPKSKLLWLSTVAFSIGAALAAPTISIAAEPGSDFYIGGNVSLKNTSNLGGNIDNARASQGAGSVTSSNNSSTNPGLRLGYRVNPNLAFEASYDLIGSNNLQSTISSPLADTASGTWKSQGYGLHVLGILPIDKQWSVYGRAGVEQWHTSLNLASNAGGATAVSSSSSNTSLAFGAGAAFAITPRLDATTELIRYNQVGDASATGRGAVNEFNVGLRYHF